MEDQQDNAANANVDQSSDRSRAIPIEVVRRPVNDVQPRLHSASTLDVAPPQPVAPTPATPTEHIHVPPANEQAGADEETAGEVQEPTVPTEVPKAPKKKRRLPIFVILLAMIVMGILAVVFVMLYLNSNNQKTPAPNTTTATTSSAPTKSLSSGDIDTTATEIQNQISALDNNKDFSAATLSDQALGL